MPSLTTSRVHLAQGAVDVDAAAAQRSAHTRFWRSIAEAEQRPDTSAVAASPEAPVIDRRAFIKIMGASAALASAGCSRPPLHKIVPYRDGPAQQTYGEPVFYATALPHQGYGIGVLVETNMGRPTKIEGNPRHPASGGGTDVFRQAQVLELWDPDRSQSVRNGRNIATWTDFLHALEAHLRANSTGERFRVLTGTIASPSLHAQIAALLQRYPRAQWHQWQPVNRDNVHAGAMLAYGSRLDTLCRFDRARVVLAIDGDFLDQHPHFVRYALDFAATRQARTLSSSRSRLYALECTPTLTGANADHRLPVRASEMHAALQQVAHALGVGDAADRAVLPDDWLQAIVADLRQNAGESIVTAGPRQPPQVHGLVDALNEHLGNVGRTVTLIAPAAEEPVDHAASLTDLAQAMSRGEVDVLLMSGVNPLYDAPADLAFAQALAQVAFKAHHGLYFDESASRCDWHLPAAHPLEAWGDLRSFDGTVALQQPCIAPLYGGKSALELIAAAAGDVTSDGRALLRAYWSEQAVGDIDAFIETSLRSGLVADSAFPPTTAKLRRLPSAPLDISRGRVEIVFAPDPRTGDGAYANNAWLQELPKPLSQLTWDNAALLSPALARRLGIDNEDVLELRLGERTVTAPAWIMPGMPDGSVTLALGHGRTAAGSVGNERGTNAYALRTTDAPWFAGGLAIARTERRHPLACAQTHHAMEGRDIVRTYTVSEAKACANSRCADRPEHRTLYDSPPTGPYAWAMSIDLSACIGCGTCTIACQAENNIPVVGREEVRNGREMHWIRVDRYHEGAVANPRTVFQPVPCMQCEHAPCEPVCPVEASVHDAQGINVQVYNRCVGTRFCSNNCPYKVRRFNFLQYSKDVPSLNAQRNPEVTVRMRGVMEKCNYCLQRITTGKIAADREQRRLRDGEIVTACQAACPTRAIMFGDLSDPASEVNRWKRAPLDYALLADLNTRPRTTYIARVTNPAAPIARRQADGPPDGAAPHVATVDKP